MPNVRTEIHADTLSEAGTAVASFEKVLPADMREEGAALAKAMRTATSSVSKAVDIIEGIKNPDPQAPAISDPVAARREVLAEAQTAKATALGDFDKRRAHIERQLEARALPAPPSGSAALAARGTIEAVVGDLDGGEAERALTSLARTADKDTTAELAGPWAAALARKHGVDPGVLRAMAEWASSQGRFGASYQSYAKALGRLRSVDEARKALGVLDTILSEERI